MISRFCKICGVTRQIDIWKVYNAGKKRVVCGHCGEVLLNEQELKSQYDMMWNYCC